MAQLTAIVDKLLTNVSSAYIPDGYISEQILPAIKVKQKTGLLAKYGDQHLRIETTVMGGRGEARRVESITRSTSTYSVKSHGLEGMVTQDDKDNVEKPYDAERDEVIGLTTMLWLDKEKALADSLTSTSVLTQNTTLSGTAQFSDYTNSDPISKFKDARGTVYSACGMAPDTALMSWEVFNTLAYHPGILDALGFTQNRAGQLSEPELAKAMGVQRLLIGTAQYNSAAEGQTDVRAAVWGKHIVFAVAPKSAGLYQTSLGYRMELSGRSPRQVFKFSINNPPNSTGIIVQDDYQQLISNAACGYLIEDAIA